MEDAPPTWSHSRDWGFPSEVISAVRGLRVGAAPGRDGIPPRVFKKMYDDIIALVGACV